MRAKFTRFARDENGAVVVDTLPVFFCVILIVLLILEIGISYYLSLGAHKAAQLGARIASTVGAVHEGVPAVNQVNYYHGRQGDFCFQPSGPDACTDPGGPWICDGSALSGSCDTAVFQQIIADMRRTYPRLSAEDVTIGYAYRRLGIVGGPFVPEINVTVATQSYQFVTLVLGPVVGSLQEDSPTQIGRVTASSFGEDLQSDG
jgi:hypothetical protein